MSATGDVGAEHRADPRVRRAAPTRGARRRGAGVDPAAAHRAGADLLDAARRRAPAPRPRRRSRRRARSGTTLRSTGRAACWSCGSTAGSNQALSRAMVVVAADTSLSPPPMTPASACARSRSAITSISASSVRFWPSSVVSVSPVRAERMCSAGPASCREVERVQRVAQLEQHVVGDVDDVADGADAGGGEPLRPARPATGRW